MRTNSIDGRLVTPQAAAVFARAEKFRTSTLEPEAFTWDFVDRRANSAALREAARLGLTGIEVDKALGGLGLGFREKVRIAEILSRSSMSFAFSLVNSQNVAARLADLGTDGHRSDFLPGLLSGRRFGATALTEPHAGSDFAAIRTAATRTSDGWVLNGSKAWITNGAIADVILCYAQTDADLGRDGIACFVVDGRRAGFESEPAYGLTAGSAIGVAGFTLSSYEATEDDLLIEPGQGFRFALNGVNGARIYVAAMACAMVRSALAEAIEYGSQRQAFGRSVLQHQGLNWALADVANRLEAAEALTGSAVDVYERSRTDDEVESSDAALAAAHAKKFAVEMLEPSLRTCMQTMGAEGLRSDNRVGRLLAEARVAGYVDGTTEMQSERIGRSLVDDYGQDSLASASIAYRQVSNGLAPVIESPAEDLATLGAVGAVSAVSAVESESGDGTRPESDSTAPSPPVDESRFDAEPPPPEDDQPALVDQPPPEIDEQASERDELTPAASATDSLDSDLLDVDTTADEDAEPTADGDGQPTGDDEPAADIYDEATGDDESAADDGPTGDDEWAADDVRAGDDEWAADDVRAGDDEWADDDVRAESIFERSSDGFHQASPTAAVAGLVPPMPPMPPTPPAAFIPPVPPPPPGPTTPPMPPPSAEMQTESHDMASSAPDESARGLSVGFDQPSDTDGGGFSFTDDVPDAIGSDEPASLLTPASPLEADAGPATPPLPPPSSLLNPPGGDAEPAVPPVAPPLPGDEHRLEATADASADHDEVEPLQPAVPPLPPDALRSSDH